MSKEPTPTKQSKQAPPRAVVSAKVRKDQRLPKTPTVVSKGPNWKPTELLKWVQAIACKPIFPKARPSGWNAKQWRTGRTLCALVCAAVGPELLDYAALCGKKSTSSDAERVSEALEVAKDELGVEDIIDVDGFGEEKLSLITYLLTLRSRVQHWIRKREAAAMARVPAAPVAPVPPVPPTPPTAPVPPSVPAGRATSLRRPSRAPPIAPTVPTASTGSSSRAPPVAPLPPSAAVAPSALQRCDTAFDLLPPSSMDSDGDESEEESEVVVAVAPFGLQRCDTAFDLLPPSTMPESSDEEETDLPPPPTMDSSGEEEEDSN